MPFRRRRSLAPIQSEKHEVSWTFLSQNASAVQKIDLIDSVSGEPSAPDEVQTGAHVKWIYLEFNLNGVDNSGVVQIFHWLVFRNRHGDAPSQDPAVYDSGQKSDIIKRGMEMLPQIPAGSGGTVQTKRIMVIKIPKSYQRMAQDDKLQLYYKSTSTSGINFCGFVIFREYS